jgi:hypothetical protein
LVGSGFVHRRNVFDLGGAVIRLTGLRHVEFGTVAFSGGAIRLLGCARLFSFRLFGLLAGLGGAFVVLAGLAFLAVPRLGRVCCLGGRIFRAGIVCLRRRSAIGVARSVEQFGERVCRLVAGVCAATGLARVGVRLNRC